MRSLGAPIIAEGGRKPGESLDPPIPCGHGLPRFLERQVAALKAELADCWPGVNQDMMNLEQELAKLKEGMRTMKPRPEPFAQPAADVAVQPAPKTAARAGESLSSSGPQNVAAARPEPAPVEVSAEFNSLKSSDHLH
jgi:hypothetical protein